MTSYAPWTLYEDDCARCHNGQTEKEVDPTGPYLICPHCGFSQPFKRLPHFSITGWCGVGKSSVLYHILQTEDRPELVYLDSDTLLTEEFTKSGWQEYRNIWLRVCFNIAQSGRPVALFSAGGPDVFEQTPRSHYFSSMHHLVLTCDSAEHERRLRCRRLDKTPSEGFEKFVQDMLKANEERTEPAPGDEPPYVLLDTTGISEKEAATMAISWIKQRLESQVLL